MGVLLGCEDGCTDGGVVGSADGLVVGALVVGYLVGYPVGCLVGCLVGALVVVGAVVGHGVPPHGGKGSGQTGSYGKLWNSEPPRFWVRSLPTMVRPLWPGNPIMRVPLGIRIDPANSPPVPVSSTEFAS